MLRTKSRFIDDEAEEEIDTEAEDSDIDDLSVTTEVAAAEDEDFIVEIVKRRFGLVELNSGKGVQADQSLSSQSTSLVGLRSHCGQGYNSDCSRPSTKSGDPIGSVQLGDSKHNPVVIGDNYSGPSSTPSGSRRKKLPKTSQQSVVPSSISERANSQRKAAIPNSSSEVSANAISAVRQETTAMDTETTAL